MQIVRHRKYGKGRVLKNRAGGFEVEVLFIDGIKRWVRVDRLQDIGLEPKETEKVIESSLHNFSAREIIESLRLGIVPYKYIEEFMFGREKEIKLIEKWLSLENENYLGVIGEYGVGKTHFLQYLYHSALKKGWAVSFISLDINEISFYKPKDLYREVIANFKFREKDGDFREFLREVVRFQEIERVKDHKFIYRALSEINIDNENEDMWAWIEGYPIRNIYYPKLYQYSTCANIYSYIITGISWIAKEILGLNGFLILFDEAENLENYWYTSYQNRKAQNFLQGLVRAANNDKALLEEGYRNSFRFRVFYESQLIYCGHDRSSFIWKIPSYLKLLFALTPLDIIFEMSPFDKIKKIELYPLNKEDLRNILSKIIAIYNKAYDLSYNIDIFKDMQKNSHDENIRYFVKNIVETLDIIRFKEKMHGS